MLLHEAADGGGRVGAEVAEGLADERPSEGARGQVRPLLLRPAPLVVGGVAFGDGGGVQGEEGQQDEGEEEEELPGYGGHHGAHDLPPHTPPTDQSTGLAFFKFISCLACRPLCLMITLETPASLVFMCVWREKERAREDGLERESKRGSAFSSGFLSPSLSKCKLCAKIKKTGRKLISAHFAPL